MANKLHILVGARQLQKFLQIRGHYHGMIDGILGQKSYNAMVMLVEAHFGKHGGSRDGWSTKRTSVAAQQIMFQSLGLYGHEIDGLVGPNTLYALERYQDLMRGVDNTSQEDASTKITRWPKYSEMNAFYGAVGTNQKSFKVPYTFRLAWDKSTKVKAFTMHKKVGPSAVGILEEVRDHYGGQKAMEELRLDLFGGCLNVRKMRGGSRWSTHAWGAAIDFDPEHNAFRWTAKRASLARPIYNRWWEIWEREGWVSLGRERGYDFQHVQASIL